MDWLEKLGESGAPLIHDRQLYGKISQADFRSMFQELKDDEARAGYKINMNLKNLCSCLYAATKMEAEEDEDCSIIGEFGEFYSELPWFIEGYLIDFPCLRKSPGHAETILFSLGMLMDLAKCMLRTMDETSSLQRVRDAVSVLRAVSKALDRTLPFHQQHEHSPLPGGLLEGPRAYVTYRHLEHSRDDICEAPVKRRKGANCTLLDRINCKRSDCGTMEPQLWFKCLVEHFGRCWSEYGAETGGFEILKRLFPMLHELHIEVTEVVLHLLAKMTETLETDLRSNLTISFMEFLRGLVNRCERELDRNSVANFVAIFRHLQCILKFLLPVEMARDMLKEVQNQIQEVLLEVATADSESAITRGVGPCHSVFDETLMLATSAPAYSLQSIISRAIAWIRARVHLTAEGERTGGCLSSATPTLQKEGLA